LFISLPAAILTYTTLSADFLRRYHKDLPLRTTPSGRGIMDAKLKTMIGALAFSTLVLFIRYVFRSGINTDG
jgi:hypothetical protein